MKSSAVRLSVVCLVSLLLVGAALRSPTAQEQKQSNAASAKSDGESAKKNGCTVQYLEIVTPKVKETCEALAKAHGVVLGDPIPEYGNARTAELAAGGQIGVRAPMRATETPVVRPYILVDDIQAAVKAASKAGATIAMAPTPMPSGGTFSIYILGGIEHGLWQK